MKQNKAYKFRIYPNEEQKILFAKTFGCTRFIYNKMLSDKIDYYKQTKQKLNNTPAQYKIAFAWLKEVDSLALANAQMNLQKAFTNFFTNSSIEGKCSEKKMLEIIKNFHEFNEKKFENFLKSIGGHKWTEL